MTENSSSTVMHALYSAETSPNPPVLFYIGDFCCAPSCRAHGAHCSLGLCAMIVVLHQRLLLAWHNLVFAMQMLTPGTATAPTRVSRV